MENMDMCISLFSSHHSEPQTEKTIIHTSMLKVSEKSLIKGTAEML